MFYPNPLSFIVLADLRYVTVTAAHKVQRLLPHHEDVWGSGGIVPRTLKLGASRSCGHLHAPASLPP